MNRLETFAQQFADAVWGTPLVILLLGGGLFFLILSRATPADELNVKRTPESAPSAAAASAASAAPVVITASGGASAAKASTSARVGVAASRCAANDP